MIPTALEYKYKIQKNYAVLIPDEPEDFDAPQPGDYLDKLDWTSISLDADTEPGQKPCRIELKNLASNIYATPGTVMGLRILDLFPENIYWIDSLQGYVDYEFMRRGNEQKAVANKIKLELRRFSGPDDLITRQLEEAQDDEADALEGEGEDPEDAEEHAQDMISPYQQDGYVTFSLVFYYN